MVRNLPNGDVGVKIPEVVMNQNHHLDMGFFRAWKQFIPEVRILISTCPKNITPPKLK